MQNAGFEESDMGTMEPRGWTAGAGMNTANRVWDHYYSSDDIGIDPIAGANAYCMTGRVTYGINHDTGLTQLIPIRGEAGDVYTVSGWMRLWSVTKSNFANVKYQIACRIKYSNGASVDIATAAANPYFIGWQYVSESFVLKNSQPAGVTITGLEIVLQMDNVPFHAAFDNIHLVKDEGQSYTYDTEGKLVSSQALREQQANVTYDETTDLPAKYTDVDGNATTYSYNTATRNLLSTTAPSGIVTTLNYDSGYGATPNSQTITGGDLSIKTSQEMKDGGNFAYSTTDALGKTSYVYYNIYDPDYTDRYDRILPDPRTAYPYVGEGEISSGAEGYIDPNPANNLLTGQIFAAVDANGNTTLYSYTEDDYLESVTNGQSSVAYTYDDINTGNGSVCCGHRTAGLRSFSSFPRNNHP